MERKNKEKIMSDKKETEKVEKKEIKFTFKDSQVEMWNEIKYIKAEYYGLPNNTISTVCSLVNMPMENVLYVTAKGPASIISIEEALKDIKAATPIGVVNKYLVEATDRPGLLIIKKNPAIA